MVLERLSDLQVFVRIVSGGSLSSAAREQGLSLAVVSARLAGLEAALGVRLLNRSTRRLSLTEEGRLFHERALQILADVADLEALVSHAPEPRGRLRVTCTSSFARLQIAPRLPRFLERYPQISLELLSSDGLVDLVREGIDLAIRQAVLPDSGLHVRPLMANSRVACAAPAYLERHGTPDAPEALAEHSCIAIGDPPLTRWNFVHAETGEVREVQVEANLTFNNGDIAHAVALAGCGIALKSRVDILEDLQAGRLVEVVPEWQSPWAPIQLVYPAARHLSDRVRVFIDFLCEEFAEVERGLQPSGR